MSQPPNLKHPGRIDRRSRQEARAERGRSQKADINPQIQAINAQIAALRNELRNFNQNAQQYPGGASPTFWMNNGSGGDLSAGDVVVVDAVTTRSVTTTTTANDPRPAAVVLTAGPTANGEDVECRFIGMADANADGDAAAIVKGDALTTHTTAKYLRKAESQGGNIIGIASENLASGQDQIAVFMLPSFKREGFVLEFLTADNAGQVTLTYEPYSDSDGPAVIIYDMANYKISFSAEWALGIWGNVSPDRACLSAAVTVVTNSLSDFDTGASQLYCFYLRADCYTIESAIAFSSYLKSEMLMLSRAETGYFDVKFNALKTIEKSWLDGISELAIDVGVRVRKELHFDAGARLTSAHWYWSAAAVNTARHYVFNYSGDYLMTFKYSQLSTAGTFKHSVTKSLVYVAGLLDKIIQEVA